MKNYRIGSATLITMLLALLTTYVLPFASILPWSLFILDVYLDMKEAK